ncbi:heparan sulfate glucosamine 3-O-sulfotransferase 1-like [Asterias rubens]|uniref:heparan sulfate glucosamine 3-O-sulfotransferase 1-like n=1 Tax=Asterias rubens TaxID=7604 RepID=UPI0014556210|nr:heparan sulfate glucosamine 3-O-sulfotransferase 1-like [Asterias rubens]XP_033640366.1 heparan sulfate glucosamine 3-O-sulfotransferase 1-like [Asterias rubens]XP_033640367.1 heparan sulfate glucosamine 3-O-sulfotransferase 1-like [Asterias rubens]XP_033640369.1 heparan sulfate glucosamine 3-O-sulfotransferase 1-like [Asterias rubens]
MDSTSILSRSGIFRSRKRLFSFSLVAVTLTLGLIMLGGQRPQGLYKIHKSLESGARYKPTPESPKGKNDVINLYTENVITFLQNITGAKRTSPIEVATQELNWLHGDVTLPEQAYSDIEPHNASNASYANQTNATVIPRKAVNEQCAKCCYSYTPIEKGIAEVFPDYALKEKGCEKRLPDAMIFGVKKGGTTTLKNFVSYHPDIAFTPKELKFFTSSTEFKKGLEYYRSQMTYSTPEQISMEKTPAYYHYPKTPSLISKTLPNVKLILIMRDPIERAVSDFVHLQVTIAKKCPYLLSSNATGMELLDLINGCTKNSGYFMADTFEKSIINSDGEIRSSNQLIAKGVYVRDIRRYLKYFKKEQILALDGEAFINDPYPTVKKVESFLGIRDYFTREYFYFDVQKGFFCLTEPIPNNCMSASKGRPHPEIQDAVLEKLKDYYRPYNKALALLMGVDLQWSS